MQLTKVGTVGTEMVDQACASIVLSSPLQLQAEQVICGHQ